MNVSRRCLDGSVHPEETLNKSQIYVTTAGWKNTFAYDKLIQLLVWMIIQPEKAIIMGGTWRIPVLVKLLDKDFLTDLKNDGTFNEASFDREYESRWSGTVEDAFFNGEAFDRCRKLLQPEYESSGRSSKNAYYIIAVDVGRTSDLTEVIPIKVTPQAQGVAIKQVVNLYSFEKMHFEDQAIEIKKLFYKYNARAIVLDGNGAGVGLVDYMVKKQIDPKTNDVLVDFGVINDPNGLYKKYRTDDTEYDALYILKSNAEINTEAHTIVQSQMSSGKIKFLIDERVAKTKLLGTKKGQAMKPEERAEYLKPFTLTSILKEQMMNLREETEGINIILKKANKSIKKDKFSALEYGLWYIKQEEDSRRKRHSHRFSDFQFFN